MSPLGTPSIKAFAASISLCINLRSHSIELRRSMIEMYDIVPIATAARMAIKLRAGSEMLVFSDSFILPP